MTPSDPSPECKRQERMRALQAALMIFALTAFFLALGHVATKAIANLAHFNFENGVYPHE